MRLFSKYSRINLITSILIFIGGCIAFYFVLDYVLVAQLDEGLDTEQAEITDYVKVHNSLPEIINTNDQQVYFSQVNTPVLNNRYSSQKIWNKLEKEKEWMRQLVFGINMQGKHYQATVVKSQEAKEDFLELILMIAAGMIAVILIATYAINRIILKRLWQPFYNSIQVIKDYDLQTQKPVQLPSTAIEEFTLLNASLNGMAARVENDYQSLKEFTGNASHEMQTPLAVIAANTESLIQDNDVLKSHHEAITAIEDAAKKLSRLNQSLLLLAKIENHQFALNEKTEWEILVNQRLNSLQELIAAQKLQVNINMMPVSTLFHQHLAEILINNLLSNAIRYNVGNGMISIELDKTKLAISNTSALPALDVSKIFNRFYRHPGTKADGIGLGLSIVQQICVFAGYTLNYEYSNNQHNFSIRF